MLDINHVEKFINSQNKGYNQNEFDAMVSFFFNIGINQKVITTFDSDTFEKYIYSNGKILNGLKKRRQYEKQLYLYDFIINCNYR